MFLFLIASCVSPGSAPDIYMAKDGEWSFDPYSGECVDGKGLGRWVRDMKAGNVAQAVRGLSGWKQDPPTEVAAERSKSRMRPKESSWVVESTTVNVSTVRVGVHRNTIPTQCRMEIDMRPPIGISG